MTEIEAKAILERDLNCLKQNKALPDSIESMEIAINALEKQIAKKPMFNGKNWYRCVNGCEIHKKQFEKDWYCPKCGQKLNWESDENE